MKREFTPTHLIILILIFMTAVCVVLYNINKGSNECADKCHPSVSKYYPDGLCLCGSLRGWYERTEMK